MDISLTVRVFQLAGRALLHAANLARRHAEDLCKQVFCRGRLNSMPTSPNSLLEPSAVRDCTRPIPPRRALALQRPSSAEFLLGRALAASLTGCVRVRPALLLGLALAV